VVGSFVMLGATTTREGRQTHTLSGVCALTTTGHFGVGINGNGSPSPLWTRHAKSCPRFFPDLRT
jgi:hypothetical protein